MLVVTSVTFPSCPPPHPNQLIFRLWSIFKVLFQAWKVGLVGRLINLGNRQFWFFNYWDWNPESLSPMDYFDSPEECNSANNHWKNSTWVMILSSMGDKPDFNVQMLLFCPLWNYSHVWNRLKEHYSFVALFRELINAKVNITQASLIWLCCAHLLVLA